MLTLRTLLPLALAIGARAATTTSSSSSACSSSITATSAADITTAQSCQTLSGDLTISGTAFTTVDLTGISSITGDLVITGATALVSVTAPDLRTISGTFTLNGLTVLTTLSMAELVSVGSINWVTLPALQGLQFTKGVTSATDVLITDTQLSSLDGISLTTASTFDVNNNRYLKTVNVALTNVTEALSVEFNGKSVNASFPDLVWARNITIRDAGSISFPKLVTVNNSIALVNNTFTDAEFPDLTSVGQSFAFVSNSLLTNISCPELTSIGGTFQLANNTDLAVIDGFAKLETVGGSIDFSGVFTNGSLPSLDDVRGGFNLQSTQTFDCTEFDTYKSSVVKGDSFTCAGSLAEAKSADGSSSTAGNGSSKSSSSSSDAGRTVASVVLSIAVAGAALFAM
ncbi:cell wall protein Ecm33 [Rhizina undulata]